MTATATTQRNEIRDRVLGLLTQPEMSNARLGQQLGVNKTLIHRIRNAEWDGVSDQMLKTLQAKLVIPLTDWKIFNTPNFDIIQQLCQRALLRKEFYAIAAETGLGKTTALRYFVAKNPNAFYVRVRKMENFKQLLVRIQRAIGNVRGTTMAEKAQMIARHLREKKALLILDDVHKMPENGYHLIYDLYEELEGEVSLIIAGTEHLKKKFERRCRLDVEGFRELNRRVMYWEKLQSPDATDVAQIVEKYGIEDPHAQNFITKRAANYGMLRNIVTNALEVAHREGKPVSREILADLQLGDGNY